MSSPETSSPEMSSSEAPEESSVPMSGIETPKGSDGEWACGCEPGEMRANAAFVICNGGPAHTTKRKYHRACIRKEDRPPPGRPYVCELCQHDAQFSQSQEDDPFQSEGLVPRSILSKADLDGVTYYEVAFKRNKVGRRHTPDWYTASQLRSYDLIERYERGSQPPPAEDSDKPRWPLELDDEVADTRAGNPFYQHIQHGYWAVARATWVPFSRHTAARDINETSFKMNCVDILASVDTKILHAICGAGLQRRKAHDRELAATLQDNFDKSKKSNSRPAIYVQELCDEHGFAPTGKEMRIFIRRARQYAALGGSHEDAQWALEVDQVRHTFRLTREERADIQAGARYYLRTSSKSRSNLENLLQALENQLDQLPDESKPMPFLLTEVGYTNQSDIRLRAHATHAGSNYLMNLFEAISYADDELAGRFSIYPSVIFTCFQHRHADIAEVLFSILSEAKIEGGRGFEHYEAGLSHNTSDKKTGGHWEEYAADVLEDSPFRENVAAEVERVKQYRRDQEDLDEQLVALYEARLGEVNEVTRLTEESLRLEKEVGDEILALEAS